MLARIYPSLDKLGHWYEIFGDLQMRDHRNKNLLIALPQAQTNPAWACMNKGIFLRIAGIVSFEKETARLVSQKVPF